MNGDSETHLFVIWDKGRRVAEQRILSDIRRRFQVVFVGEMSFPCPAPEGYCRFYGARNHNLTQKVSFCGDGPFLVVVVRVTALQRVVDQDGKVVNALMFSCKKTYRRWCGGLFRVHGTLQPAEFEHDIRKLTGHGASEWERGVPPELHMELPALESLPLTDESSGTADGRRAARRSKGELTCAFVRTATAIMPSRRMRRRTSRLLLNLVFGASVRRKAKEVGRRLRVWGPCSVTRRTSIGDNVAIGGLWVFGGGEVAIANDVHLGADVNALTKKHGEGNIVIDAGARIGARATLLPGTHIGEGAIVKVGAVVQGEVSPLAERRRPSVAAAVMALADVTDLQVIVERRSGLLHRCVLSGVWHGKPCIVKWTDNDPGSIANEHVVGRAYFEASGGLSPEMYYFRQCGDQAVCIMERLSGKPLLDYLRGRVGVPEETQDLARQIDGLFAVMRRIGMCHRDLHANNIFVTADGTAKLFDFQNSALASQRVDALAFALRTSRAYIYEYRSAHLPVIGLFNDCEHLLAHLEEGSPLRHELETLWSAQGHDDDYYCPVGVYHAVRFVFRSVGVLLRTVISPRDGKVATKLREKRAVTWPTLRYWLVHGVTGAAGFVKERRPCERREKEKVVHV